MLFNNKYSQKLSFQLHTDSTCSRSSCSECVEDSEASDEDSVLWENNNDETDETGKFNGKNRKPSANRKPEESTTSIGKSAAGIRTNEMDSHHKSSQMHSFAPSASSNLPKTRFNIPKPELKVSSQPRTFKSKAFGTKSQVKEIAPSNERTDMPHMTSPLPIFSKTASQIDLIRDFSGIYSPPAPLNVSRSSAAIFPSSFSADQVDHMGPNVVGSTNHDIDYLKYQTQVIEKVQRPLPRIPQQQHKVIEIVPKPPIRQTSAVEWRVPDQTLGIPVISPSSSMNHLHAMPSSSSRPIFNYAMHPPPMPMMPSMFNPKPISLLKSKSMYNIASTNTPQVIHQHPLVSGHIPPSAHFIDSYTLKRNATATNIPSTSKMLHRPPNINAPSILSSPSTQPNVPPKKENGEKNKVKFSDTVTVAVVPVRTR